MYSEWEIKEGVCVRVQVCMCVCMCVSEPVRSSTFQSPTFQFGGLAAGRLLLMPGKYCEEENRSQRRCSLRHATVDWCPW